MKKLAVYFASFIVILLISTSCSESSDQPSSPSTNTNISTLDKSIDATTNASGQFGKFGLVGKIFSHSEANILFGDVMTFSTISATELRAALGRGSNYILFTLKNNQIVIRNEKRQYLSRERVSLMKDETMYFFSKSVILQLLNAKNSSISLAKSTADNVFVELREGVLTLSYGDATLEQAQLCPPICWD